MATARYTHCLVRDIRKAVERRLELPAPKSQYENAWAFWKRVAEAGLLVRAIKLYDRIAASWAYWSHVSRETKEQFWQRVEQEGRRAEAERALSKLLASHMSQREAQKKLVECFQPMDGSPARFWPTPDPWEHGRLLRSKEDQDATLALAEDKDFASEQDIARNRLSWARLRREEAQALAVYREAVPEQKAAARRRRRQARAAAMRAEPSVAESSTLPLARAKR
jgi:hypothetical protein